MFGAIAKKLWMGEVFEAGGVILRERGEIGERGNIHSGGDVALSTVVARESLRKEWLD